MQIIPKNISPFILVFFVGAAFVTSPLLAEDWQQFRGNSGLSVAQDQQLPLKWKESIAWTKDLPGRGPSSPIVVGNRVIVTCSSGAKQDRLHVLAFDVGSGKELWHRQFWATGRTYCHDSSGIAAPTPASDGKQVYAFFSSNDLICLDVEGNLKWYRGLGLEYPKAGNDIGMASSPVVVADTVVVQVECQGESFAAGFNTSTGETRWKIERPRVANWASPTVLRSLRPEGDLVILQSSKNVSAHDPITGRVRWDFKAECKSIPSLLATQNVVYAPAEGMTAISIGSDGSPSLKWKSRTLNIGSASPVLHKNRIYAVNSSGVVVCGDAEDGSLIWRKRLKGRFWMTPVATGDQMLFANSDGLVQVIDLKAKGNVLASSDLGEAIQASPAVVDGAVYLRSDKHLWKFSMESEKPSLGADKK